MAKITLKWTSGLTRGVKSKIKNVEVNGEQSCAQVALGNVARGREPRAEPKRALLLKDSCVCVQGVSICPDDESMNSSNRS